MRSPMTVAALMLALGGAMESPLDVYERRGLRVHAGKRPCPDRKDRRAKAKAQRAARRKNR